MPQPSSQIFLATVSGNYREGFQRIAREYRRLHPNVQVKVQVMPVNGYETWLRTQIPGAGDKAPDLFNANYAWGMYEKGLLVNLAPCLNQLNPYTGKAWIDTLNPQFIEKFKTAGGVSFVTVDFVEIGFYYNASLFRKLGLRTPATWEEMLTLTERIRAEGYLPFAVPGNADSYWSGTVGWIVRFFTDAYTRQWVPLVMSRPGDWDYDPARNANFRLDLSDPYNDSLVIINGERLLDAVRQRRFRFDGARFAELYTHIKHFSRFWQKGFHGANSVTAYNLFLTGRAAVLLEGSWLIGDLMQDMADLPARARFDWGIFPVPPLTTSRFKVPPFRGVGGPGLVLGVVKKNPQQTARVVDFLMFLTSPRGAQILVDEAVRNRRALSGPMLIPDVKMPPELQAYYRPFEGRGFEKLSFRGLMDEQESVWQWTVWAQRYMDGRISVQEFLTRYQRLMEKAVPRVIAIQKLDMDPRTKDTPS